VNKACGTQFEGGDPGACPGATRTDIGPDAAFRPDQLEAIESLVVDEERLLLVQRTGWGKSTVYFIATKLLREKGAGPTLIISPLLALMHNQIQDAEAQLGLEARTIHLEQHG